MQKFLHIFFRKFKGQKGGYALITALIFFLTASAAVIAGISDAVFRETKIVRNESTSKQSYFLAESGAEDISYRRKNSLPYDSTETYVLGSGSTLVTSGYNPVWEEEISSVGDVGGTKRIVKVVIDYGNTISFPYVLQAGVGGIDLSGGATIQGDIYTLGSIRGCSTCTITGTAVAAGKSTSVLDQDNSLPETPPYAITFGTANATQDFGQSFKVSNTLSLTKLELFIKKTGNPSNATIRITTDNAGKPTGSVLASGTLSSSLVGTSYHWQNIPLTSNPILTAGTTYWILIDGNTSASNYYTIATNSALEWYSGVSGSYSGGLAKIGRNNTWDYPTPYPYPNTTKTSGYFKIYIGENEKGISGESPWNQIPVSSAYSYEATYVNSTGALYCQIGTDNNKACDPSRADPVVQEYPVENLTLDLWKQMVEVNEQIHEGNYYPEDGETLYGMKIIGDLYINGGKTVGIGGIVWVTGSIYINGDATVYSSGYNSGSVIIADGTINLSGGAQISPSDYANSHLILISTSNADAAIDINGGASDTILYAPYGGLYISGGAEINAAAAEYINANGGAKIIFNPAVTQVNVFLDGRMSIPFGIKSWKETE